MASKFNLADTAAEDAPRLRLVVARLGRHLRAVEPESALTPTQESLLSTVVRRGRLGLSEVARIEGLDAPSVSRAVAALERRGLFRRLPHPSDGRAATVEATAAGRRLHERRRAARNDTLRAQLAKLDAGERDLIHAALPVLESLADALKLQRERTS